MHNFESHPSGFSSDSGHWNYSACSSCGATTNDYKHGDFSTMYSMESFLNKNVPCIEEDDVIIARVEAELRKPAPRIF